MSIFLNKDSKVPVTIDGKNVIYVRSKLNLGAQTRLVDGLKMHRLSDGRMAVGVGEGEATLLLLKETILDWEGPEFEEDGKPVPVNDVTLQDIDITDPLFAELQSKVQDLYMQAQGGTSPNLPRSRRTTKSSGKQ